MLYSEKMEKLHKASGETAFAGFARLLGVNTTTLRRTLERQTASLKIADKIADCFLGVTAEMLLNPDIDLPEDVRLSPLHHPADDLLHEGKQLEQYMSRNGIRQADLARMLDVTRVNVHIYQKTRRFTPEVRKRIADALGRSEEEIFAAGRLRRRMPDAASPSLPEGIIAIPLLKSDSRRLTLNQLTTFLAAKPGLQHVYYVDTRLMNLSAPEGSLLAVSVSQADKMAPCLPIGSIVICERVGQGAWQSVGSDMLLLMVENTLRLYRMYKNQLRTGDTLEVGGCERNAGPVQTLRLRDLQAVWRVLYIMAEPV